jgi:DNA gyrase/topoisomerase IV subunit A
MAITTQGLDDSDAREEIRETGRNTMGVKLINLKTGEKLQAIAPVVSQAEEETASETAETPAKK